MAVISQKHLDLIKQHSNNKKIEYTVLFLTMLGCISQLYHHTKDYVEKDVIRELNRVSTESFDLPDQTLCFQFVYLLNLNKIKEAKPIIIKEVEKYFQIHLTEELYYDFIENNSLFKEYFIRKVDEHVVFREFNSFLFKRSEIFEKIEPAYSNRIGFLELFEIHRHCLIKKLIRSFYVCYTFTCSKLPVNDDFDNSTLILDYDPPYKSNIFSRYKIKRRYLLSYLGKNILFKIHLKKSFFLKTKMKKFFIQLHEPNRYPRRLESLICIQSINPEGFKQLYTYSFYHVRRLPAPFKSNCSKIYKYQEKRNCQDRLSQEKFKSLFFGTFYSASTVYDNLSLGLNDQYFFYKYHSEEIEAIDASCSFTNLEQCEEQRYYIFASSILPSPNMILQLMIPINSNYICEDRPKLGISEYLLKGLSILNFWFGFTIIQMLFNLHGDIGALYKRISKANNKKKRSRLFIRKEQS